MAVGIKEGRWDLSGAPNSSSLGRRCQEQLNNRQNDEDKYHKLQAESQARLGQLKTALITPGDPGYAGARTAITLEESETQRLQGKLDALKVETVKSSLGHFLIAFPLVVLFALLAARLAAHQGLAALGGWSVGGKSTSWRKSYWSWVLLIFCVNTAREVSTSIIQTEGKSWFAWSSFCVSSSAWTLNLVLILGVAMLVAYPAAILWQFGRSNNRPMILDWQHKDGQWGIGSYVLFLQTWASLSLVALVLPGALWLRAFRGEARFTFVYLLPGLVLLASVLLISGRMIRNAILIRNAYRKAFEALGNTWQEIKARNPPPDPTINFLGEHWWKLPTVIFAIFGLLWLIVEQIGISDLLVKLTGVK
ncbi:MAG TPA: hypothetical protein DC047_08325 [Blastocatellia bacterium]|nr:hypothetical protein [Blastocatellia bacterium]